MIRLVRHTRLMLNDEILLSLSECSHIKNGEVKRPVET